MSPTFATYDGHVPASANHGARCVRNVRSAYAELRPMQPSRAWNHPVCVKRMLKCVCFCVITALLAFAPAAYAAQPGPADIVYRLSVTDRANGTLDGTERISFTNSGAVRQHDLWLRLWGNGPGGCALSVVRVRVIAGARASDPTLGCTALRLRLSHSIAPGDRGVVVLAISIALPETNARLGRHGTTHLYGNAIPTVAPIVDGRPALGPYLALGDPFVTTSARWDVSLTHRANVMAATSGDVIRRSPVVDGWITEQLRAPSSRDFMIATGAWRVTTGQAGGVRLRVLAPKQVRNSAALFGVARRALRTFTGWLGGMGRDRLDIVITPGLESQGMEYPGVVLSEPSEETVVHEVAHQWFSVLVGSNGASQPWLDETPTTYVQLAERDDLGWCNLSNPLADFGTARLDWTLAQFTRRPGWYDAVYAGGACALQILAQDWGEARVLKMLRGYTTAERGLIATSDDLIGAIRAAAPAGYDVDGWLRRVRLAE